MMNDPEFRMATFSSPLEFSACFLVKARAPINDLLNAFGSLFYYELDHFFIAQAIPRDQGILDMFLKAVVLQVVHHGDAALRIFSIRFISSSLGDDGNLSFREL